MVHHYYHLLHKSRVILHLFYLESVLFSLIFEHRDGSIFMLFTLILVFVRT